MLLKIKSGPMQAMRSSTAANLYIRLLPPPKGDQTISRDELPQDFSVLTVTSNCSLYCKNNSASTLAGGRPNLNPPCLEPLKSHFQVASSLENGSRSSYRSTT